MIDWTMTPQDWLDIIDEMFKPSPPASPPCFFKLLMGMLMEKSREGKSRKASEKLEKYFMEITK